MSESSVTVGAVGSAQPKRGLVALVDPAVHGLGPLVELGRGEPKADLVVGRLNRVRTMADVATDLRYYYSTTFILFND